MQGIALDPNFNENKWVYVYYSPKLNTPSDVVGTGINEGDAPEDLRNAEDRARLAQFNGYALLSRFKWASNKLDFTTEQEILRVNMSRGICCHVGGQIDFDNAGNLYLSTGDDTNPFQSAGYTPIDDRANRNPAFDARRTSGNTNDLRGKILRIRVRDDGSYFTPQGNLFRPGQAQTRPEIYAMGLRNPFRFAVNKTNGHVYIGDYSPDSSTADPLRGPEGTGRWMIVRNAVNYGWPFCATPDQPYIDYDFTPNSTQSGEAFNCFAPINDSRNNTGLRNLPQVALAGGLVLVQHGPGPVPGAVRQRRAATASARWAARRMQQDREHLVAVPLAERLRGSADLLRVVARLREDHAAQPAQRQPARRHQAPVRRRRRARTPTSSSTTRWTWSSARTTRCTRSSTARATSPSSRRRSSRASTTCATGSTRRS